MTNVTGAMTDVIYVPTGKAVTCAGCRRVLGQVWRAESATALRGGPPDLWFYSSPGPEPPKLGGRRPWIPPHRAEEERRRLEARRRGELADRDRATGAPALVLVTDRVAVKVGDVWQLGARGTESRIPLPATIKCYHCPDAVSVVPGRLGWKARPATHDATSGQTH